jgi:hypothetical protein
MICHNVALWLSPSNSRTNRKCRTNYGMGFIYPSKAYSGMQECISCKPSLISIIIQMSRIVPPSPATKHKLLEYESHARCIDASGLLFEIVPLSCRNTRRICWRVSSRQSGMYAWCYCKRSHLLLRLSFHTSVWYSWVPSIGSCLKLFVVYSFRRKLWIYSNNEARYFRFGLSRPCNSSPPCLAFSVAHVVCSVYLKI